MIAGELDLEWAHRLEEAIADGTTSAADLVVTDLRGFELIGFDGIGVLVKGSPARPKFAKASRKRASHLRL